jgi:hypothetical protein
MHDAGNSRYNGRLMIAIGSEQPYLRRPTGDSFRNRQRVAAGAHLAAREIETEKERKTVARKIRPKKVDDGFP